MRIHWLVAAAWLATLPALAQTSQGTKEEQAACRGDVRKLCGQIRSGDNDKYKQCLQGHFSELSQKCQEVLMKHQSSN